MADEGIGRDWVTPLTRLLGLRLPIVQAPMAGGWTTPALVAAVSEAGGLGMLAAARMSADRLRDQIAEVRRRTRRPFGINVQVPEPDPPADVTAFVRFVERMRRGLDTPDAPAEPFATPDDVAAIALELDVPVLTVAMGSPARMAELVGERIVVGGTATTVAEAETCVAAGARFVVAQGAEAGGHRATFSAAAGTDLPLVGTLALVPQVVDAVRVPVVAAGGIMDGRGVAAALALGAAAAQLGTRFLLARESGAPPGYRRRLLDADETATVVTRAFTGRPARSLRNGWIAEFDRAGVAPVGWPLQGRLAADVYRAAIARDDPDRYPVLAGQGLRLARRDAGAAEIVAEIVTEARDVLRRLADSTGA